MRRVPRWVVVAGCSYEIAAITTGRAPTLTQLSARHRILAPALVAALAVHLWRQPGKTGAR